MTVLNLLTGVFGEPKPEQTPWLELMREQVARLGAMVGELRDFVHMELHDDLHPHSEDFYPAEAVDTALRSIRQGAVSAGVVIETDLPRGLPKVRTDPDRLARTISSLLFHARKFRSSGAVSIGGREAAGAVELWVEYTGPVLNADRAAEALDLYFPARQGHGQAQAASGLGLGVLREVLRRQGGDLLYGAFTDGRTRLTLLLPKGGA